MILVRLLKISDSKQELQNKQRLVEGEVMMCVGSGSKIDMIIIAHSLYVVGWNPRWRSFTNWRGNPQEHEEHKRGETLKLTRSNHTYARSNHTKRDTMIQRQERKDTRY